MAAPRKAAAAGRGWGDLTPAQQQALAPLAEIWNSLSRTHQRKWLALSKNFPRLTPDERMKLYSRMSEWAGLSTQERAQARLNFGETKQLSAADKKAMWEAYKALPAEEKSRLAAGAAAKPPTTAAAVKPVASRKLTRIPAQDGESRSPRIASAPATNADADPDDAQSGRMTEPARPQPH